MTKAPIAGAEVCADGTSPDLADELMRMPFCDETDEHGRYEIANLLPTVYFVHASARTYRPALYNPDGDRQKRFLVVAEGAQRTGVDLALQPGGVEVTGTVSDLTGGPIARARVRSGTRYTDRGRAQAETDERGRFSLWVSPGSVGVTASADGYASQFTGGRAPGTFDLQLAPEATIAGIVVDATTGKPVEGARVTLSSSEGSRVQNDDFVTTFSGADGTFQIGALSPERYVVTARTEHSYGRTEGSLRVGLGQRVEGAVVRLFAARRIEGKVLAAGTRQPCADGEVRLRDALGRIVALQEAPGGIHTGDGMAPGTYTPLVTCHGFVARDSYPSITVGDKDVTDAVWEVDSGTTLRGRITTGGGAPVDGASVTVRPAVERGPDARIVQSSPDGAYEIVGLRSGGYRVVVMSEQGRSPSDGFAIEISGATVERDFAVDDAGTLAGTVVDTAGMPVGGLYIWVRLEMRIVAGMDECRSDAAGTFSVAGSPPATTA